jgi:hypothetical protein
VYQNAGVDLKKDAQEGALAIGRRTSQGLKGNQFKSKSESKGNTYYEYRANRLDVKQPKGKQKYPKLADGGMMNEPTYDSAGFSREDDKRIKIYSGNKGKLKEIFNEFKNQKNELRANEVFDNEKMKGKSVFLFVNDDLYDQYVQDEDEEAYADENFGFADGGMMAKGGKLVGKQKKLDVNHNGKLDAEDFKMLRKQRMAEGGITEKEVVDSNAQMVLSQIKAVKHHADELSQVVSKNSDIEAWVVAKIERASTDLSDITHYLDGQHEKMSMGGSVYHHAHKMDKK